MTNNKKPINSAKDMQGLKMRVPNSKAYIAMMQAIGASTVAVDLSELYLALRQGVADGQDTPPSVVKSNKYYEVQKYVSKTDHILTVAYTVVESEILRRPRADEKKAFDAACKAGRRLPARIHAQGRVARPTTSSRQQGMQVNLKVDVESFRAATGAGAGEIPRPVPARTGEDGAGDARIARSVAGKTPAANAAGVLLLRASPQLIS